MQPSKSSWRSVKCNGNVVAPRGMAVAHELYCRPAIAHLRIRAEFRKEVSHTNDFNGLSLHFTCSITQLVQCTTSQSVDMWFESAVSRHRLFLPHITITPLIFHSCPPYLPYAWMRLRCNEVLMKGPLPTTTGSFSAICVRARLRSSPSCFACRCQHVRGSREGWWGRTRIALHFIHQGFPFIWRSCPTSH